MSSRVRPDNSDTIVGQLWHFVDAQNRIQWDDLAGGVVGVVLLRLYESWIGVVRSVGIGVSRYADTVAAALTDGLDSLAQTFVGEWAATWDPLNLGFLSLPVNAVFVLVALFALVAVIQRA